MFKLLIRKNYLVYSITNKRNPFKKFKDTVYININLSNFNKINKLIEEIEPHAIIHLASKNVSSESKKSMNHKIHYKENLLITKKTVF